MSGERWIGSVTGQVAMDPTISLAAKGAYLVLAVHADQTGYSYPSVTRIAAALGKSRATIQRALAELERADVVERQPRFVEGRQTTNGYVLVDLRTARGDR